MSNYCIREGYKINPEEIYLDTTDARDAWQAKIYRFAYDYAKEMNYIDIIDYGCGNAYKTMNYLPGFQKLGIEIPKTVEWLRREFPRHNWLTTEEASKLPLVCDMVLLVDVIEHVLDPDALLEQIKKINFKILLISTPERHTCYYPHDNNGPPANPCHIREWDFFEFQEYIGQHFKIHSHQIVDREFCTQLIECSKK